MKQKTILVAVLLLAFTSVSCSLFNTVAEKVAGAAGNTAAKADEMWPDVPLMDGLVKADFEIPFPIRMAIEAFVSGFSESQGSMAFMAFTSTSRSAREVMDYYNPDLMAQSGWSGADDSGCTLAENQESGGNLGAGCFYIKEGADRVGSILAIVIGEDSATNQLSVFFIRFDGVNFSQIEQP